MEAKATLEKFEIGGDNVFPLVLLTPISRG